MSRRGDDHFRRSNGFLQNDAEAVRRHTRSAVRKRASGHAWLSDMYENPGAGWQRTTPKACASGESPPGEAEIQGLELVIIPDQDIALQHGCCRTRLANGAPARHKQPPLPFRQVRS
jgi:hypothetical protein